MSDRQRVEVVPGYILDRFIGRGGHGEVWRATGPGGIRKALKILSLTEAQGIKEFRAISVLKNIRHPNLVSIDGLWMKDDEGRLVEAQSEGSIKRRRITKMILAMELGEKSLRDRLTECRAQGKEGVPPAELLRYMDGAAGAIDFLNEPRHTMGGDSPVGIQHCDIKPANILIVGNAAQVCDFGVARVMSERGRGNAANAFAPAYAAPELIRDNPCRESDQYSLAITYYELRSGELPFRGPDLETMVRAHLEGKLDFSRLSEPEQEVLRKATSLAPARRYGSCTEMVEELRAAYRKTERTVTREDPTHPTPPSPKGMPGPEGEHEQSKPAPRASGQVPVSPKQTQPAGTAVVDDVPEKTGQQPSGVRPREPGAAVVGVGRAARRRLVVAGVLAGLLALGAGGYLGFRLLKPREQDGGKEGKESPGEDKSLAGRIDAAVNDLAEGRDPLLALPALRDLQREAGSSGEQSERLVTLLKLADLARQAGDEPQGDAVTTFERELESGKGLTPQDRKLLGRFRSRLHDRRVEKAVPGLPGAWGWEGALAECRKVSGAPSLWALACRVECLVELDRARGQEWDEATRALREGWQKGKSEAGREVAQEVRAYVLYVLGLTAWKDDNPGESAGLLLDAFGTDKVPAMLEQAHRKNGRLPQIVTAAVGRLRDGGTIDRPFKSAENAALAFAWLGAAQRVAGGDRNRDFNRALAAWHKTSPEKKLAGELAARWLRVHGDARPGERYALGLVRAGAARAEGTGGRKAALDAYLEALKAGRALAQEAPNARLSAHVIGSHLVALDLGLALLWEKPEDADLAGRIHAELMAPAVADGGKALLGSDPPNEAKEWLAEFLARSGRAVLAHSPSWSGVKELGDPRKTVAQWAARAYALAPRAEYLALQVCAKGELSGLSAEQRRELKEGVSTALRQVPGCAPYLTALALLAREENDYADRIKLLKDVDERLRQSAGGLARATGPEYGWFFRAWSGLCLELAASTPGWRGKEGHTKTAQEHAQRASELSPKDPEAQEALALALEQAALNLNDARGFETAATAFSAASRLGGAAPVRTRLFLERARCLVRWGLADGDKTQRETRLNEAEKELQQVAENSEGTAVEAEARLWRGRALTALGNSEKAEQEFRRPLGPPARVLPVHLSEEVLICWANLASREATESKDAEKKAEHLGRADKCAKDLEKTDPINAALVRVAADYARAPGNLKEAIEQALERVKDARMRLQDRRSLAELYFRKALLALEIKDGKVGGDVNEAASSARKAVDLAADAASKDTEGRVRGTLGLALWGQADRATTEREKKELRREATQQLKQALELAPNHSYAPTWRRLLAESGGKE